MQDSATERVRQAPSNFFINWDFLPAKRPLWASLRRWPAESRGWGCVGPLGLATWTGQGAVFGGPLTGESLGEGTDGARWGRGI